MDKRILVFFVLVYILGVSYFILFGRRGKKNNIGVSERQSIDDRKGALDEESILKDIIVKGGTKVLILVEGDKVEMRPITADKSVRLDDIIKGNGSIRETKVEKVEKEDMDKYTRIDDMMDGKI